MHHQRYDNFLLNPKYYSLTKGQLTFLTSFINNLFTTFTDLIIGGGPPEDPSPTLVCYLVQQYKVKRPEKQLRPPQKFISIVNFKRHSLQLC